MPDFDIEIVQRNNEFVTRLCGELDLTGRERLERALGQALADGGRTIVLDLTDLRFVEARAVVLWHSAATTAQTRGNQVVLRNPSAGVRRLLEVLALGDAFVIQSDGATADPDSSRSGVTRG